ncbi:DUF3841 domain-containing protein [Chitinilyticum piscinae]|uniref:DUF3841 domain-containing protein n=1 Tax=Chitinilyticum piscinae TaxID=2866724 RepID=A0A8J7FNV7_9NEIS|nr:DUF3841 domain-containing protein [Chitinilyticum piscinae]MBE9610860.1 DUF3841 domain-containing protein [Chitinilyticum piscinae]
MLNLITAQDPRCLSDLFRNGFLVGRRELIDPDWEHAYVWMMEQMQFPNPYDAEVPMWSWLGKKLRCRSSREDVVIQFRVDEAQAKVSDFINWHNVLNNINLTINQREFEELDLNDVLDRSTWMRIFEDLHIYPEYDPLWIGTGKPYQVCTWHILLSDITRIKTTKNVLLYTKKRGIIWRNVEKEGLSAHFLKGPHKE